MRNAVIVDVVRTYVGKGKPGGALSDVHPVDLLASTLQELEQRTGVDTTGIDDVLVGCVTQAGEQGMNIARTAVLAAGWPETIPATTIDRQCGSSQQAVHFAAQGIMAGAYDIVVAAGVESMSRAPMFSNFAGSDNQGPMLRERYPDGLVNQGIAAELIAHKWELNRAELDDYAARSHRLAARAQEQGFFDDHVLTDVAGVDLEGDETVRAGTTSESLAGLKPSFATDSAKARFPQLDWRITPGNSSPLSDGASAALIMEEELATKLGLRPRARFHSFAVVGDDPLYMLTGPIPATRKVLDKAQLTIDDIDTCEVNEAFAPVVLAWAKDIGVDLDRVNPRGGAIALGHALGSSGVRLLSTMLNHLEATGGRYGLQTMCEGGGMANAMIIERLEG